MSEWVQLSVAVRSAEEVHGLHHPETATALRALGDAALGSARYDEAEVALRRALAILQTQPDPDRPALARVLHGLGRIDEERGRADDAEAAHRRARTYEGRGDMLRQ